jgi:YHS domain-containing protein
MKRYIIQNLVVLAFISFALNTFAQSETIRLKNFNINDNIALGGYDPVSYFDGEPREGSDEIKVSSKGITYLFSSRANADKFKANPGKYEPAYGGWCAYAMGKFGEKVKVDPETYKIIEGKLYLFYNFWGNNTLESWNENEMKLKESADGNWQKIFR